MNNTNSLPTVTIVMPVYNAELYLNEAIESILNQTFSDFEFHIIDDGSSDASVEIIKSYSDSRIFFFRNEINKGIAQTLNHAYSKVNTKYIARMDADDVALSQRLQTQINFMENNPAITIAGSWFASIDFKIQYNPFTNHDNIAVGMLEDSQIGHPTIIIRNENWKTKKLFYENIDGEDYHCWCKAIIVGSKLANIPESLHLYRSHEKQYTITRSHEQICSRDKIRLNYALLNFPFLRESANNLFSYQNLISGSISKYKNYKEAINLCEYLINSNLVSNMLSDTALRSFLSGKIRKGALDFYCIIKEPTPILFIAAFFDRNFYKLPLDQIVKFPVKLLKKLIFG